METNVHSAIYISSDHEDDDVMHSNIYQTGDKPLAQTQLLKCISTPYQGSDCPNILDSRNNVTNCIGNDVINETRNQRTEREFVVLRTGLQEDDFTSLTSLQNTQSSVLLQNVHNKDNTFSSTAAFTHIPCQQENVSLTKDPSFQQDSLTLNNRLRADAFGTS